MEIVPLRVTGAGASHAVGLPYNRRNVEEWSRLDSITGMMEKAKIQTDRWSASNSAGKHNFAKVVDSRERNLPDGSLQQRQRKQMEVFESCVPGGSMQVIRTQTVTSSSSSSWSSGKAFGELQLPVNSLDLSSQKTKGSVGRSGSISTRRPPSRPRSLATNLSSNFSDLSAECHRLHEEAKARIFGNFNGFDHDDREEDDPGGVVITEIDSSSENSSQKTNLSRQKSCSNENVNDENSIQRSSKFRRSLQSSRMKEDIPDWTNGKSLRERAAEIEKLLRSGSTSSFSETKKEEEKAEILPSPVKVKSSFVSAEALQEVRDRLKKSSTSDTENRDDGIVPDSICVKDFISGFEEKLTGSKNIVNGTGSLSLRSNKSQSAQSDWIRRRRSYGFEKVDSEMYGHSNGESSTDSGLGNSETNKPFKRFLNEPMSEAEAAFTRKSPLPSRERSSLRCNRNPWLSQLRGTKLIDRDWSNGTPDPENGSDVPKSPEDEDKPFDLQKKQKKVEFCKTEVHFAEPGRVQIVETDGKPPSSAAVRRRRRSERFSPPSNPLGLPEVKFGDSLLEKEYLGKTSVEKIDHLSKRIESELKELSKIADENMVKREVPVITQPKLPKLYDLHEENDEPRSILKNFRNSFHAGDSNSPVWKSTVVLRNKLFDDLKSDQKSYSSDGESELQIRFRNLRRTDEVPKVAPVSVEVKRRSFPDEVLLRGASRITATIGMQDSEEKLLSVAERIRQAEEQAKYSSKIDFRSGEATVLQNGTTDKLNELEVRHGNCSLTDIRDLKSSNPPVKRFPAKETNMKTTRISINIPSDTKPLTSNKKPARSSSFGGSQRCEKPQSASLVMRTLQESQPTNKPVSQMIHKFDSLSRQRPVKTREQRRNTMPINFKAPKEYTHKDLEEELRSFTENLDKDFKDIYEEEIGSIQGSCRDLKKMFEKVVEGSKLSNDRFKTLPLANGVRRKVLNGYTRVKCKNEGPRRLPIPRPILPNGLAQKTDNGCESDDSDLLADEEVRSYMSAGHGGSDSDDPQQSKHKKKSFERIRLQFKRLELRDARKKDVTSTVTSVKPTFVDLARPAPVSEPYYASPPKVASIALRYEDDPTFHSASRSSKGQSDHWSRRQTDGDQWQTPRQSADQSEKDATDQWEKTSNTSSVLSDGRPRERASFLRGPSLSEKYSKTNSSLDNLFEGSALQRVKEIQENLRNSFRSSRSSRFREVTKEESPKKDAEVTLEELSKAANDMVAAANGLTDDSFISSSEDENTRKVIKKNSVTNLGTISEGRKTSVTSEPRKLQKTLSSRATRLMQRASNREAAIAQRSSSEDIPTHVETTKKKLSRRPRTLPVKLESEVVKGPAKAKTKTLEKEVNGMVPRERAKTVSSAAKEVTRNCTRGQSSLERPERTKPTERRELLAKADALAEKEARSNKRNVSSLHSTPPSRNDPNRDSLTKRRGRISLRKVEAARISQAV